MTSGLGVSVKESEWSLQPATADAIAMENAAATAAHGLENRIEVPSFLRVAGRRGWRRHRRNGLGHDVRRDRDDQVRILARLRIETKEGSHKWQVAQDWNLLQVADVPL